MINNLPFHIYQRAREKYLKFKSRLDKNVAQGTFRNFTRRKQRQLIQRLERLRKRLQQLQLQLKLAGTGLALGVMLNTSPVQAQSTLGPFDQNLLENPLPPPLPYIDRPAPTYVDIDADGDQDLVVGKYNGLKYFKNIGSDDDPYFEEKFWGDTEFPFAPVISAISGESVVPSFADIDNDGDFDMLVGTDRKYPDAGELFFFRNTGTAIDPVFEEDNTNNPFVDTYGIKFGSLRYAHPVLVDMDKDGDIDLLLGGYYDNSTGGYLLQYFENIGSPTSPLFEQKFNSLTDAVNNIYSTISAPINVADLDEDGDLDVFLFYHDYYIDKIIYFRNDNGIFAGENYATPTQTGPWIPNPEDPGASQGNPFDVINNNLPDYFQETIVLSFVDLDNDGDLDVTLGYDRDTYYNNSDIRSLIYYENKGQGVFELTEGIASPVDGIDLGDDAFASMVDMDNDGDLDIVASGSAYEQYFDYGCECWTTNNYIKVQIFENIGSGFVEVTDPLENPFAGLDFKSEGQLNLVDVDSDGDIDIVVPYEEYDYYSYGNFTGIQYFKNIEGTYVEQTGAESPFDFLTAESYQKIELDFGDLNGDGLLDLIVSFPNEPLSAFENVGEVGNPEYVTRPDWDSGFIEIIYEGGAPKLLDLDNDGDLDIVTSKYGNIWYYENIGDPTSPEYIEYRSYNYLNEENENILSENNPFEYIIANTSRTFPNLYDFDGDGDNDLLLGDEDGRFDYHENQNLAPITTLNGSIEIEGGSGPIALNVVSTIEDEVINPDLISEVIIAIVDFQSGNETLTFEPILNITGEFDSEAGTLTLRGLATQTDYLTAINSIVYEYTGSKPAEGGRKSKAAKTVVLTRTLNYRVFDVDLTTPPLTNLTVQITFPNSDPILAGATPTVNFTAAPVIIGTSITTTDGDDANLEGATIQISSGLVAAEDRLLFTDQNGITGNYNTGTGTLILTGISSVANYQTAIRSIQYNNLSATPNPLPRVISFTITDGESTSNAVFVNVTLPGANIPPTLGGPTPDVTFVTTPVVVANSLTVSDSDDTNMEGATIAISTGFVAAEDELLFTNQNGISGTYIPASGVLVLTGTSSITNYQIALRSIQYNNSSATPSTANRAVTFTVNDGTANSNILAVNVLITPPANSAPVLGGTTPAVTFSTAPIVIGNSLTVSDSDDTDLVGATIAITSGLVATEDQLLFTNQNGISGSYNASTGILSLTGTSSVLNYETAIRSVQYNNTSALPNTTNREVTISVTDGSDASNSLAITVLVAPPVNVAPVLGGSTSGVTFSTSAIIVANAVSVIDSDDTNLEGATIQITTGLVSTEDQLLFTNQNGISGTYNPTTGVLALSGSSSVANYQTAIRSIQYNNTATTPNTQNRTVSFIVTDGTDTSNSLAIVVSILVSNSPPQISPVTQTTQIGSVVTINLSSLLSDPDNNLDLASLQVVSQPASGATATISGTQLEVDYSAIDFAGTDQLTIEICDLSGACSQGIITVEVEGDIVVYNGFSPNGDDKNRYFRLANIEVLEPSNKVSIFNRWGTLVFEIENYNNTTRRFEGLNNNGHELPSGVYFYKIEFISGRESMTGYVTLKK